MHPKQHPVKEVLDKQGVGDVFFASTDRLSRVSGHLLGLEQAAKCRIWTAFLQVNTTEGLKKNDDARIRTWACKHNSLSHNAHKH